MTLTEKNAIILKIGALVTARYSAFVCQLEVVLIGTILVTEGTSVFPGRSMIAQPSFLGSIAVLMALPIALFLEILTASRGTRILSCWIPIFAPFGPSLPRGYLFLFEAMVFLFEAMGTADGHCFRSFVQEHVELICRL